MSAKMAKINVASSLYSGKNIVVILKLNILEIEEVAIQLNTEQDSSGSLEDGRWYLELLGVGLSFRFSLLSYLSLSSLCRHTCSFKLKCVA